MSQPTGFKAARHRQFSVLDLMIFVVASGLAFLILRNQAYRFQVLWSSSSTERYFAFFALANLFLMSLTFPLSVVLLRSPREPVRVILRRPGPAACLAATTGIIVMAVRIALKNDAMMSLIMPGSSTSGTFLHWMLSDFVRIGYPVLGAWIALSLSHGWRRERSAIGWACQAVGWGWVLMACLPFFSPWLA